MAILYAMETITPANLPVEKWVFIPKARVHVQSWVCSEFGVEKWVFIPKARAQESDIRTIEELKVLLSKRTFDRLGSLFAPLILE